MLVALGHDALGAAVHDDVNTRVAEQLLHLVRFAVAPCLEGGLVRNGVGVAAGEIVEDDDAMPVSKEGVGGGGANVSGATGEEDRRFSFAHRIILGA